MNVLGFLSQACPDSVAAHVPIPSLTPAPVRGRAFSCGPSLAAPSLPSCSLLPTGIDQWPVFAIAAPLQARSVPGGLASLTIPVFQHSALVFPPSAATRGSNSGCWHHLPFRPARPRHKRRHSSPLCGPFPGADDLGSPAVCRLVSLPATVPAGWGSGRDPPFPAPYLCFRRGP